MQPNVIDDVIETLHSQVSRLRRHSEYLLSSVGHIKRHQEMLPYALEIARADKLADELDNLLKETL